MATPVPDKKTKVETEEKVYNNNIYIFDTLSLLYNFIQKIIYR